MRVLAISHERDAGPGVFTEAIEGAGAKLDVWHRAETDHAPAAALSYDAVISFGGAMHADQEDRHTWIADETRFLSELLQRDTPVLGVCLGAQLLAAAAGGEAVRAPAPEIGWYEIEVTDEGAADPLLAPLAPAFEAFEWHSYECRLPAGATVLARSPVCVQAYRIGDLAWGIQFHAEVTGGDAASWVRDYGKDEDAVRIGVDPDMLESETTRKIGAWNELGRELCERWLAALR